MRGFGIDQVAAAASAGAAQARPRLPVLRMENLDTDLPLPPEAVRVTADNLETPEANSWLPFTGDLGLREAVADFTAERTGHRYDPEREIVITAGGMEGLLDVVLATVNAEDGIVVTDPTYAGIVNRVHLAGGTPKLVPFQVVDQEWRLDEDALRAAVDEQTTGMLLMSPSMPSGGTFTEDDWAAVCAVCREHELPLLYDSAMERLLFDDRPLVHPLHHDGMAERTAIVGSLSKEHRMIGWRVGWIAGPAALVADAGWMHVYNTTTPTGVARAAARAVLRGDQGHVGDTVAELQRRRDAILDALAGWPTIRPAGGWSLLIDARAMDLEPAELSNLLLEDAAIAATPMTGWGGEVADRHVRLVFSAEPPERLRSIPDRIAGTRLARY